MVKFRNGLDSREFNAFLSLFSSSFFGFSFLLLLFFVVCWSLLYPSSSMLTLPFCSYLAGSSQFNSTYLSLSVYLCCCCCFFCWCCRCGCCCSLSFLFGWENQGTIHIRSSNNPHSISMCVYVYDDMKTQVGVNSIHIENRNFFFFAE